MSRPARGAGDLRIAEDIVPIAKAKAQLSAVVKGLRRRGRPLVITQNGKPAAVLISPEAFDRLAYEARFVAAVRSGIEDADAGRVYSDDELDRLLERRLGSTTSPKRR